MKKKDKYNYFKEFISLADCIVNSANIFKGVVEKFNIDELEENIKSVHTLENDADRIVHTMRGHLIIDFLPPIDREDIALISKKLDNIEDGIDEALINLKILDITEIKMEVVELVDILVLCCEAVKNIFINLNNFKNIDMINQKVVNVNKLEEEGDRVFENLMTSLYKNEKDPINLVKWTNLYNDLEDTIDRCEELGDCIEDVVMKNS